MTPITLKMFAIWGNSLDRVWVAGDAPYEDESEPWAFRNNDGWQMFPLGNPPGNDPDILSLWGGAPDDIWAGAVFGHVWHYDGTTWDYSDADDLVDRNVRAAWGTATNNVYLGAEGGTLLHYDGVSWTGQILFPDILDIYALGGTGSNDIWAVGENGEAHHFDGNAWTSIPTGIENHMMAIGAISPNDVWVGLWGFGDGFSHWDGSMWTTLKSPKNAWIRGIWTDGASDVWAVSDKGPIFHYDGVEWTIDKNTDMDLRAIRRVEDTLYAVGESTIWFRHD